MGTPTVHPYPNLQEDCRELRSALKGYLCNEKKVIDILGRRSQQQRESITEAYKILYEESLHKRLKACFSGRIAKCLLLGTMHPSERDAALLYEALRAGGPSKDRVVIGVLCSRTPAQIYLIKQAYYYLFQETLENHLDGTGFFLLDSQNKSKWAFWKSSEPKIREPPKRTMLAITKLLLALARGSRPETMAIDRNIALSDAHQLNKVCTGKLGNEENLIRIFCTRSPYQLTASMNFYQQHYGHDFEKALSKKDASEFLQALKAVVQCLRQPSKFYAEELWVALSGAVVDEDAVIQIITTRAEVDLQTLKAEFKSESKKSLEDVLSTGTSGHLRQFLLNIVRPPESTFTPRTSIDGSGKSYYMSPLSSGSGQVSNSSPNDSYYSGSLGSNGSLSFHELY